MQVVEVRTHIPDVSLRAFVHISVILVKIVALIRDDVCLFCSLVFISMYFSMKFIWPEIKIKGSKIGTRRWPRDRTSVYRS